MNNGWWLVALVCGLNAGCASGQVVAGSALVHTKFPYAVTYDDQAKKSIMGEEWDLENYRKVTSPKNGEVNLERKPGYESKYAFDFDDDDKTDASATLPSPDLIFVSRKTNARIEVTTLLLDKRLADKELRVLLSNIVDNASGTRALFVGFGRVAAGVEKRFASRLLESGEAALESSKGLVATVERADVDQLQLNPNARWRRSRLVLVHAPFDYYVAGAYRQGVGPPEHHKYRVLLLVEYTNSPEDFESQYPDFLRLLNKIHLLGDDALLEYLAEPLAACKKGGPAKLIVKIDGTGEPIVSSAAGLETMCTKRVLSSFRFSATGEARGLEHDYDFSKSSKPAWLTRGAYSEQRVAPAEAGKTEMAKTEADKAEPSKTETAKTETDKAEPSKTELDKAAAPAASDSAPPVAPPKSGETSAPAP